MLLDGTARENVKENDEEWTDEGTWQVEENNVLVITYEEDIQKYEIIDVTPKFLDVIDLSSAFLGEGSRLFKTNVQP